MNRHGVQLRYLWDSQRVIAIGPRGEVLASEPLASLIIRGPRRPDALPKNGYGYEIDAIRDAVIAEAHLAGLPAPRGWARRLHGKAIQTSEPRETLGTGEPRLPEAGPLEGVDA